jgi:hypothetical protein
MKNIGAADRSPLFFLRATTSVLFWPCKSGSFGSSFFFILFLPKRRLIHPSRYNFFDFTLDSMPFIGEVADSSYHHFFRRSIRLTKWTPDALSPSYLERLDLVREFRDQQGDV